MRKVAVLEYIAVASPGDTNILFDCAPAGLHILQVQALLRSAK